jgi:membrane protease YdiL (CAAX protease family)
MIKFLENRESGFIGKLGLIGAAFAFLVLYTPLFIYFFGPLFAAGEDNGGLPGMATMSAGQVFLRACIIAPVWEELAFRFAPLQLAKGFDEKKFAPAMIVLSSCVFGIIHGGVANIFVQGVAGVCLSCVYIKSNYSLWTNITLHALWNTFVIFIIPLYV